MCMVIAVMVQAFSARTKRQKSTVLDFTPASATPVPVSRAPSPSPAPSNEEVLMEGVLAALALPENVPRTFLCTHV